MARRNIGVAIEGPTAPDVGAAYQYVLKVTNKGPSEARDVSLITSMNGADFVSASSSDPSDTCTLTYEEPNYGGYAEVRCELGSLASGDTATITVAVERTSPWEVYNSAYVTTSNLDENYENDYAFHSIAADPSVTSDLSLKLQGPEEVPLVGTTFDMTMTITNGGPSPARAVTVVFDLGGATLVSATPQHGTCAGSVTCSLGDLPVVNATGVWAADARNISAILYSRRRGVPLRQAIQRLEGGGEPPFLNAWCCAGSPLAGWGRADLYE